MKVFARYALTPGHLLADDDALLLEGSWPETSHRGRRWSLDDEIDARYGWVDDEAARLADELTAHHVPVPGQPLEMSGLAWLDALRLRYELVKLIRIVAFFEAHPECSAVDRLEVYVERDIDHDYEGLLKQIARAAGARLTIVELSTERRPLPVLPVSSMARRALAGWSQRLARWTTANGDQEERILFCGNPQLLDPVCRAALDRGCRVWWLYERFAVRHYLAWRSAGVEQLVCDTGHPSTAAPHGTWPEGEVVVRGCDISAALEHWSRGQCAEHGAHRANLLTMVARHFETAGPTRLVLDEDASPLQRAAVATARAWGTSSTVVQHGIPAIRFGYAPIVADQICVWNQASAQQLAAWQVEQDRIRVTGSPAIKAPVLTRPTERKSNAPNVVLLATTPADSRRPDCVRFHLTCASEHAMLRAACRAVERVRGHLLIRLHPRRADLDRIRALLAEFPMLSATLDRNRTLQECLSEADCVLSCASTAGFEARLAGLPVVQLLPPGSGEMLADDAWGWHGTARDEQQLETLLRSALTLTELDDFSAAQPDGASAARAIVDQMLSAPRNARAKSDSTSGALD